MSEVDESFSYTTLFLLRINLLFGNRRELSLVKVLEGRRVLETITREDYICFKPIDEQKEFMNFLDECSDILYYKNGFIVLNDDVTVHNIDEKINDITVLRHIDYDTRIFKYLKITQPIELIYRYYKFEKRIEKLYMSNSDNKNNKKIEELFKNRKQILDEIESLGEDYIAMITTLHDQIYEDLEEDYVVYPIDITKYEQSDHFDENTDIVKLLDIPSQNALFTYSVLYRTKVKYDLDSVLDYNDEASINDTSDYEMDPNEEYYDDNVDDNVDDYEDDDIEEFDSFEEFDSDFSPTRMEEAFPNGLGGVCNFSRKETIFSLQYITILESMKERYKDSSKEINRLIKRLKYLNDNIDVKLYEKNSDEIAYILSEYRKLDDGDYMMFADEVMYFINEIFTSNYDRFFLQKVLFIKTYYSLTNDMEIINYINEFKSNIMYNQIYEIITGEEPGKIKLK